MLTHFYGPSGLIIKHCCGKARNFTYLEACQQSMRYVAKLSRVKCSGSLADSTRMSGQEGNAPLLPGRHTSHSGYRNVSRDWSKGEPNVIAHPKRASHFSHPRDLCFVVFELPHEFSGLRFLFVPGLESVEILQAFLLLLVLESRLLRDILPGRARSPTFCNGDEAILVGDLSLSSL